MRIKGKEERYIEVEVSVQDLFEETSKLMKKAFRLPAKAYLSKDSFKIYEESDDSRCPDICLQIASQDEVKLFEAISLMNKIMYSYLLDKPCVFNGSLI